ncbi:MAG: xanthine dehydrogenase family protein subunit M [Chloroflexota bacterium]|nr:xanthine dehydrogenase family protein subunit M [Chloroflexota bacterium]
MHPAPFTYHRAGSVAEALNLLQQYPEDGKLLAGGQSLLPVMKLRLAQPAHLIDISRLDELSGVRRDGDTIHVGALTTHYEIEHNEILRETCPILPEAAHVVGDQQVRNLGTLGGVLAHADPAADYPASILALDAHIIARGLDGERVIPAPDCFVGFLTTALQPHELLTEVRIPVPPAGTGMTYQKVANQASGYAVVGVAVVVNLADDGTIARSRIGITGAGDHAVRAFAVESALQGKQPDEATLRAAAESATEGIDLLDDHAAPLAYRDRVTRNLTRRALTIAVERASKG